MRISFEFLKILFLYLKCMFLSPEVNTSISGPHVLLQLSFVLSKILYNKSCKLDKKYKLVTYKRPRIAQLIIIKLSQW